MAAGDFKFFAQGLHDLGNKIHDLDNDDWRMGIVTSTTTPAVNTAAPHWGGTGTTNFATNQVATGTAYTGPIVLTAEAWTLNATGAAMDVADVTISQDASGFTNGRWGIVYNNTDANKRAIGYLDLGSDRSIVGGSLTIQMNASGILSLSQA
ncbi:MAG: hypothetical protein EBR90_03365 [Actinobacteria bacterium]|nr:hypothetical protein [Actinomycetota bacterium]